MEKSTSQYGELSLGLFPAFFRPFSVVDSLLRDATKILKREDHLLCHHRKNADSPAEVPKHLDAPLPSSMKVRGHCIFDQIRNICIF